MPRWIDFVACHHVPTMASLDNLKPKKLQRLEGILAVFKDVRSGFNRVSSCSLPLPVKTLRHQSLCDRQLRLEFENEVTMAPQLQSPRSALLSIPPEILYMVADYTSEPVQFSLALTCKRLRELLYPPGKLPLLDEDQTIEFLHLIEQGLGGYHFCYGCYKLITYTPGLRLRDQCPHTCSGNKWHPWGNKWQPWSFASSDETLPGYFNGIGSKAFDFEHTEARLAVNHKLYGHGLPAKAFERRETFDRWIQHQNVELNAAHFLRDDDSCGLTILDPFRMSRTSSSSTAKHTPRRPPDDGMSLWSFEHNREVRILEGGFCVSFYHHVTSHLTDLFAIGQVISSLGIPVCEHIHTSGDLATTAACCVPEIADLTHGRIPKARSVGSCQLCLTDYEIEVEAGSAGRPFSMTLTTFHNLGSSRHPGDLEWKMATGMIWVCNTACEDCDLPRRDGCPLGMGFVRDLWRTGEPGKKVDRHPEAHWLVAYGDDQKSIALYVPRSQHIEFPWDKVDDGEETLVKLKPRLVRYM